MSFFSTFFFVFVSVFIGIFTSWDLQDIFLILLTVPSYQNLSRSAFHSILHLELTCWFAAFISIHFHFLACFAYAFREKENDYYLLCTRKGLNKEAIIQSSKSYPTMHLFRRRRTNKLTRSHAHTVIRLNIYLECIDSIKHKNI